MGCPYFPTKSEKGPPMWGLPWVAGNLAGCVGVGVGIAVASMVGVAVGAIVAVGVFPAAGVLPVTGAFVEALGVLVCAPWVAMATTPTQPSMSSASTPSTTHSQVRRFFGGCAIGGGGGPGCGPYCVGDRDDGSV